MFAIHLKRNPVRWFIPFALLLGLAVLFLRDRSWIGVWPETSAAAQIAAFLTSGIASAGAAWSANTPYRHAMIEQIQPLPVPQWRRELPSVLAVVVYFASVSLLIHAVGFVMTARSHPVGLSLWPGYVVMGLIMVCLAIAYGHVVGKLLSGRFAAAVAGLSWQMLSMFFGQNLGFAVLTGPVYQRADLSVLAFRLLWALALLGLAVVLPHFAGRSGAGDRGGWRPVTLTAVAVCALTVGVMALGHPVVDRQRPDRVLCTGTKMQVCLWPEHEKYLGEAVEITRRAERLPTVFRLPPRVEEYGISYRSTTVNGLRYYPDRGNLPPYFYVVNGSKWSVAGSVSSEIIMRSVQFCAAPQTKGTQSELLVTELSTWLEAYLAGGGRPDYRTSRDGDAQLAAARGVARANNPTEAEQWAWAANQIKKIDDLPCL